MIEKKFNAFKKTLEINDIISVSFIKKLDSDIQFYKDTACTALARAIFSKKIVVFDAIKNPQLCPGAMYFMKSASIPDQQAIDVYVKKEKVFNNDTTCMKFLKKIPQFPSRLTNKFIQLKPFSLKDLPDVIIFLITPAQTGRILGLLNHDDFKQIIIIPNQPTCIALFAPLVSNNVHINFIDYYDRYYQGKIENQYLWPENRLLVSMKYKDFMRILKNFNNSAQGSYQPDLKAKKIDRIDFLS